MIGLHAGSGRGRKDRHRAAIGCEMLEGRVVLSTLREDVAKLAQDVAAIRSHSQVTSAQIQALAGDLKQIAAVATKPDPATVTKYRTDLTAAAADGKITVSEAATLKKDAAAVLTSAGIPTSLSQKTAADLHAIVTASGVTSADVKTVAADIKAILVDLGNLKKK